MGRYGLLADAAAGLGRLGAGFVGINPVHAGFPEDPLAFSPYAPSDRRRLNVLHAGAGGAGGAAGPLIDHREATRLQRAALETGWQAVAAGGGDPGLAAWRAAGGAALEIFALHQALSERHGPYWGDWPAALRHPDSPEVRAFAARHPDRVAHHAWRQWCADRGLAAAAAAARGAGMAQGLYLDLAVGTHPFGAETWAERALFAAGHSLGAPPDAFAAGGQTWGLAPLRPDRLLAAGMAPLAAILRAQFRHAGMLRIDHILGFERSFWVPEGLPGLYVAMPREAMLAVVRIEAARAGAVVVGEDLGNVPEGLRARLAETGVLGCRVAMFERDWSGDGAFLPASAWPQAVLAAWGSHDLPPWRGWRSGRDIAWRRRTGALAAAAAQAERAARRAEVAGFAAASGARTAAPDALHRFLAATPACLVAVQAEDVLGAAEQANLPGTVHEHPNWRRRLAVDARALADDPRLRRTAAQMAAAGRAPPGRG
jgi:4-alpha-glucanotransferase